MPTVLCFNQLGHEFEARKDVKICQNKAQRAL